MIFLHDPLKINSLVERLDADGFIQPDFCKNKKPNHRAHSVDNQFHLTIFIVTKDATSFPVGHR